MIVLYHEKEALRPTHRAILQATVVGMICNTRQVEIMKDATREPPNDRFDRRLSWEEFRLAYLTNEPLPDVRESMLTIGDRG